MIGNYLEIKCADCGNKFYIRTKSLSILSESIKRNPKLKIICQTCARKEVIRLLTKQ